jgi:hypothetical protein
MAGKPRLDVPGGFYHVLACGNRRATIFHDDADYRAYQERPERYRHRDGVTLHAYVLMPNHVRNFGSRLAIKHFAVHGGPVCRFAAQLSSTGTSMSRVADNRCEQNSVAQFNLMGTVLKLASYHP